MAKRHTLLVTYNIKEGSNADAYDKFLREVDNPFIGSVPGVISYANWKIVQNCAGSVGFKYIDLIVVEGDDNPVAIFDTPEVAAFKDRWDEEWGEFGVGAEFWGINSQVVVLEGIAGVEDPYT
ncbi:hypothetical protein [Rhodococcus jostii]|uniref:Uncharacterized protein n=1 Tax=Rhodococcus jostii TaxID=132919 RepID=A0A1H4JM57_RHOJO|nr:hypothetical protein [Rhodococcus jostii]SEB47045.1 hypothetical protein SAMN04490220_0978 [Rhodococcus jostii]